MASSGPYASLHLAPDTPAPHHWGLRADFQWGRRQVRWRAVDSYIPTPARRGGGGVMIPTTAATSERRITDQWCTKYRQRKIPLDIWRIFLHGHFTYTSGTPKKTSRRLPSEQGSRIRTSYVGLFYILTRQSKDRRLRRRCCHLGSYFRRL